MEQPHNANVSVEQDDNDDNDTIKYRNVSAPTLL